MKLKCNVCKESPTVLLPLPMQGKTALCPSCGKQLAYVDEFSVVNHTIVWKPIDTDYNEEFGGCPVSIVKYGQTVNPEIITTY